jgi:hypothetical protein
MAASLASPARAILLSRPKLMALKARQSMRGPRLRGYDGTILVGSAPENSLRRIGQIVSNASCGATCRGCCEWTSRDWFQVSAGVSDLSAQVPDAAV